MTNPNIFAPAPIWLARRRKNFAHTQFERALAKFPTAEDQFESKESIIFWQEAYKSASAELDSLLNEVTAARRARSRAWNRCKACLRSRKCRCNKERPNPIVSTDLQIAA